MTTTPLPVQREPALQLGPGLGVHPSREGRPRAQAMLHPTPDVRSLPEILVYRNRHTPEELAFRFIDIEEGVTAVSYRQLYEGACMVATALRDRGIGRGDTVIVSFDTSAELLCSFFGCGLIGAVPVPTYPPAGVSHMKAWQETLDRMMRAAGSHAAVVDPRFHVPAHAVAGQFADGFAITPAQFPARVEELTPPELSADELAFLQFTSGTTAIPKGVMVTQRGVLTNARYIAQTTQWNNEDYGMVWLPLYHDMGLVGGVIATLLHGVPVTLMPPLLFLFRPRRWLWAVHHYRATLSPAPNFAFALCVDRIKDPEIEGLDIGSWRVAWNGAEFVNADTIDRFMQRYQPHGFRRRAMYPVYGMAETVLAATFPVYWNDPRIDVIHRDLLVSQGRAVPASNGDPDAMRLVGTGITFPGHQIQIVDGNGRPVGERQQGQILLRGPSLARGYINNPEATAASFKDGWFHTGDLGYIADGELFVCGRIKDLIIKGGRNYYPYDIELAAGRVPEVRTGNVAAFAVPNAKAGTEDIVLLFETRVTEPEELKRVVSRVELEVTHALGIHPDKVVPLPPQTLPKTTSGKIQRAKAREAYLKGALRPGARAGQGKLAAATTLGSTYLRFAMVQLRRLPLLGSLAELLFPRVGK